MAKNHQEFQVPKMEVAWPEPMAIFGGGETPVSISRIHTAYMTVRMNPPF